MKGRNQSFATFLVLGFHKKNCLTGHISTMHEGKKPFKCDICGTGFTFRNTLNRHIQNIHEKIDKGYVEHSVSQDPLCRCFRRLS